GNFTGSTLSGGRFLPNRNSESGIIDRKGSLATRVLNIWCGPNATPLGGNFSPLARKASAISDPKGLSSGGRLQGSRLDQRDQSCDGEPIGSASQPRQACNRKTRLRQQYHRPQNRAFGR